MRKRMYKESEKKVIESDKVSETAREKEEVKRRVCEEKRHKLVNIVRVRESLRIIQ